MTIYAVFRSRMQALDALSRLKRAGIAAAAVPTPEGAGCGCGLSVRYDARLHVRAVPLIRDRYTAFAGFYRAGSGVYVRI